MDVCYIVDMRRFETRYALYTVSRLEMRYLLDMRRFSRLDIRRFETGHALFTGYAAFRGRVCTIYWICTILRLDNMRYILDMYFLKTEYALYVLNMRLLETGYALCTVYALF
jgi:hypothetical protein